MFQIFFLKFSLVAATRGMPTNCASQAVLTVLAVGIFQRVLSMYAIAKVLDAHQYFRCLI